MDELVDRRRPGDRVAKLAIDSVKDSRSMEGNSCACDDKFWETGVSSSSLSRSELPSSVDKDTLGGSSVGSALIESMCWLDFSGPGGTRE